MVDTHHQLTLYINDACSKGCSFCFIPDEVKAIDREMSIPMLERLIDEVGVTHFQIQGGEPTEHSQFKEIMHMFARKNVTFHMLSALLFSESMCDTIIHHINAGTCLAIHPNCAELDEVWGKEDKTRLERWKRNYLRIYEAMSINETGQADPQHKDYYNKFILPKCYPVNFHKETHMDRSTELRLEEVKKVYDMGYRRFKLQGRQMQWVELSHSATRFMFDDFVAPALYIALIQSSGISGQYP